MLDNLPHEVRVVEVGPRDGLQNEHQFIGTDDKIKLIESLAAAGLRHIEVTSFVSPKWIPQLADCSEVVSRLNLPDSVQTSALVPNMKGLEAALKTKLPEIAIFLSASESHSKKNINKSIDEAISTLTEVAVKAKANGKRVRCYLSVVFACPYEGKIAPAQVASIVERLVQMGVDEISLGDTIGHANPREVVAMVRRLKALVPLDKLALHCHDTRGTALANVLAGLEEGVTIFDSSLGGMGGCPYAPGAAGNLATEDLVGMLEGMGIKTGIDIDKLVSAGELAQTLLGKELPGRYLKAALAQRRKVASS